MKVQMKSKKAQKKTSERRVVPLSPRALKESVTTIGYDMPGVQSARTLKLSFQEMKERLGGKGAGLTEMARLKIPVPPAFNVSTSICGAYLAKQRLPEVVLFQMKHALAGLERKLGRRFGSKDNPLLLSVRSGARVSMPGMMDTILNLGLNQEITESLANQYPDRARFWWDCYRRLIQMFSEVVLGVDYAGFDRCLSLKKDRERVSADSDLSVQALKELCWEFTKLVEERGFSFPQDSWDQLVQATQAVFASWNTERAVHYRQIHRIPEDWGTAVTVQAMVFGNLNNQSATGVVFTRNPSSGEKELYGEFLVNAQGEDVVAGIRTPEPITKLKAILPKTYQELLKTLNNLETHFNEVQDVEFTIEESRLYILQTRNAKRTARASLSHALQFVKEKRLKPAEALLRLNFDQVRQLLHPTLKVSGAHAVARGLPASPGAASGRIAFDPEKAVSLSRAGHRVILVRRETSPEDIMGMSVSEGILTATGGMTSHAAVVGRGMGKCCVVGCSDLNINEQTRTAEFRDTVVKEEDWITLNGSTGEVFVGELPTQPMTWGDEAQSFFKWTDQFASIPVYANADTPEQAQTARELGARGIGLCRTEHMFFEKERIHRFRLMILSENQQDREEAAQHLKNFQSQDFYSILKVMQGFPVTVRLLDPPLHEFLPSIEDEGEIASLSKALNLSSSRLTQRIFQLRETNPMLGHRGCRLGVTFPEIYEMQVEALAESMIRNLKEGTKVFLKIMIPLTMSARELEFLLTRLKTTYDNAWLRLCGGNSKLEKLKAKHTAWGTMIELPRACVIAKDLSPLVDFISFGTNDLTQTTFGISRDDAAKFIPTYLEKGILATDPFETIDAEGVGRLIEMAVKEGRMKNPKLDVGICGEHGGDPASIPFFNRLEFNSVSCSPYRVPLARLALARTTIESKKAKAR